MDLTELLVYVSTIVLGSIFGGIIEETGHYGWFASAMLGLLCGWLATVGVLLILVKIADRGGDLVRITIEKVQVSEAGLIEFKCRITFRRQYAGMHAVVFSERARIGESTDEKQVGARIFESGEFSHVATTNDVASFEVFRGATTDLHSMMTASLFRFSRLVVRDGAATGETEIVRFFVKLDRTNGGSGPAT
jgi:hypothetical protein